MTRVVVLTSSSRGAASQHLPPLLASQRIEVGAVVYSQAEVRNRGRHYRRKLEKLIRIGPFGAVNGIRMRRWYGEDTTALLGLESLEEICGRHGIPLLESPTINCAQTVRLFQQAGADVGLSLGNAYIGSRVFRIPKHGMLNIHHELLPDYQNAQSVIWQLYNGSDHTGYTIHKIDRHIDTGEILYQERVPIRFRGDLAATVAASYAGLWEASARGLVRVLEDFEHYYANATPQGEGRSYTTPSLRQYLRIRREFERLKRARGRAEPGATGASGG